MNHLWNQSKTLHGKSTRLNSHRLSLSYQFIDSLVQLQNHENVLFRFVWLNHHLYSRLTEEYPKVFKGRKMAIFGKFGRISRWKGSFSVSNTLLLLDILRLIDQNCPGRMSPAESTVLIITVEPAWTDTSWDMKIHNVGLWNTIDIVLC